MKATLTIVVFLLSGVAIAQDKLSVVQQAMRDEMERSLKDLKADGFDKPFFINYTLLDETSCRMSATLGALINSIESTNRAALSIRLLVGDYEFNDESLDNNLFSQPQANEVNLPLDDDYLGIRRSLWISTDNVYRNASRQFAKNKELLKEQNKPLAEVPHRSFTKATPSKIDIEALEVKFDKTATEDYIRKVSAVFAEYPDVYNSNVSFAYRSGYRYLVNSEGSMNRIPVSLGKLVIAVMVRTAEGEIAYDHIQYNSITPELQPIEKTIAETKHLIETVISSSKAPRFAEEYTGPVLFEGREVANLFSSQLFNGEDRLVANNNIPSLKGMRFESPTSIETKIGKPVFAEGMTVKALPKMKKYGEEIMLGAFEADDEGVIPADETVLVENGILKTVLNDRTITKVNQLSNGLGDGPGVVAVTFKNVVPMAEMKAKLITQAKKEGLDYGLLVKGVPNVNAGLLQYVYKVYVADGREELIRDATIKDLSQRNFRKILGASKETAVYHQDRGAQMLSMICPLAVLLEEVEFMSSGVPSFKDEEYVPSPLKK